jgi:outer membrane biosynthesis protein TonB
MSHAEMATGPDRLPWLTDEPQPRAKRRTRPNPALAAGALVVIAAASFWIGTHEWPQEAPAPTTTVRLPPPRVEQAPQTIAVAPQPEVKPAPIPEVQPAPQREVKIAPPPSVKVRARVAPTDEPAPAAKPEAAPAKPAAAPTASLKPWNPRASAGAAGRLAQVGAFGSRLQAKRGWWTMVRAYPAMARLPALVVETRNSRGRHFYRFQIGTTSQAHSEVLCQRMQKIRLSCAVVGLPWKPKGVER